MKNKVILLGFDGMDFRMTGRLLAENRLPNLARLAASGSYSALKPCPPPQSPVVWASIATGKNPGHHGIFDFLVPNRDRLLPELGILRPRTGLTGTTYEPTMRATPFWEVAAEAGIPASVIHWPMTFPATSSSSRVLAGLGVPDIKGGLGRYAFYTTRDLPPKEEGHEKVTRVACQGDVIEFNIEGPQVAGLAGKTKAFVRCSILVRNNGRRCVITLQGNEFTLEVGKWSPWTRIEFDIGMFRRVSCIARFLITEADEHFSLYLTPLHIDPQNPCFSISSPKELSAEHVRRQGLYHTLGLPEDTKALTEHRISEEAFLEMCEDILQEQDALFRHELDSFKEGILASVFCTYDRIQHVFWHTQDSSHHLYNKELAHRYGEVIEHYYRRADAIVGEALRKADDKTLLIICSDHGFGPYRRSVHLNTLFVKAGIMAVHGELDALPDGGALFGSVDWSRTKAYALGLTGVYVNLAKREKQGVVSQDEYDKVCEHVRTILLSLRDEDGSPIVASVNKRSEIYSGPWLQNAPDLVVGFNEGYRVSWQTAIGGMPACVMENNLNKWSGDHCTDPSFVPGVLFTNRPLQSENATVYDIAPTIMRFLNLSITSDGRSLL